MAPEKITLSVTESDVGKRLDVFICEKVENLTRSRIKSLIDDGQVLIGEFRPKPSSKIIIGTDILLTIPEVEPVNILAQKISFGIIFEDKDIIVVNKPAGLVVHPAAGNPENTLVNGLMEHCRDLSGIGGEIRPGIVHRLDKGTSGVIIIAKNDAAHLSLANQFKNRTVTKKYLAVILGRPKTGKGFWDHPIGRHKIDRKKMSTITKSGRLAKTNYELLAFRDGVGLLSLKIETGRTHQIRVHCQTAGCPVASDETYGGVKGIKAVKDLVLRKLLENLDRPALHAHYLGIKHPTLAKTMEFKAELPDDMNAVFKHLGVNGD